MSAYAIVLGRNYTSRLGMIRAAGMAGCRVAVIKTDKKSRSSQKVEKIDASSKYVDKYLCAKEPDDEALVSLLLNEFGSMDPKPVLLPTDDYTAAVIDKNIERLRGHFVYPSIGDEPGAVVRVMDKGLQKQLAAQAGLAVAKGWTAVWLGDRYDVPQDIEYPCFMKPEVSYQGSKHVMQRCDSREQLTAALAKMDGAKNGSIIIEQFIEIEKEYDLPGFVCGSDVYLPGVIEKGIIYLGVTGTGTMYHSEKYRAVIEKLRVFLSQLGFTGLVDIELYEAHGVVYFNELNMRFGASGFAMTASGVNMPQLLIRTLCREPIEASYRLAKEGTFASEKVCFQKYLSGQLSWKDYQQLVKDADFCFVSQKDDPKPGRTMKLKNYAAMAKRILHGRKR